MPHGQPPGMVLSSLYDVWYRNQRENLDGDDIDSVEESKEEEDDMESEHCIQEQLCLEAQMAMAEVPNVHRIFHWRILWYSIHLNYLADQLKITWTIQ